MLWCYEIACRYLGLSEPAVTVSFFFVSRDFVEAMASRSKSAKGGVPRPPEWVARTAALRKAPAMSKMMGAAAKAFVYLHRPTPGIPPPPRDCYGNPELMALHSARWLECKNIAFQPSRFTSVLNGRPWQCLVITHNEAPSHEYYNRLAKTMFPLRPVCINGVSAKTEAPKMKSHYCVTQWWKWKGLEYMSLPEFPDDQGFIVCESDFVFTKKEADLMQGAVTQEETARESLAEHFKEMMSDLPDTSAGAAFKDAVHKWEQDVKYSKGGVSWKGTPAPSRSYADGDSRLVDEVRGVVPVTGARTNHFSELIDPQMLAPPTKKRKSSDYNEHRVRPEVQDITDYFNIAAKRGQDDVCWMGWSAEQWTSGQAKRKRSPSTGAHLVLLTAKGARTLKPLMQECKDMHMGSTIKLKWLQDWVLYIKGTYIVPPIGGFYTHMSTTDKGGRVLKSHLDDRWAQEGTRRREDHPEDKLRYLCLSAQKGHEIPLGSAIDLPEMHQDATWITQAPPGTHEQFCGRRPRHNGAPHNDIIGFEGQPLTATRHEYDAEWDAGNKSEGLTFKAKGGGKARKKCHRSRVRRTHIRDYCQRIFSLPGQKYDVEWRRPQALRPQHGENAPILIQGWVPPEVHYPGDTLPAQATKAAPQSRASSSKAPPAAAQDEQRASEISSPTIIFPDSESDEDLTQEDLWKLLD